MTDRTEVVKDLNPSHERYDPHEERIRLQARRRSLRPRPRSFPCRRSRPARYHRERTRVAQSYDASHDYTASCYKALNVLGYKDWEVCLTTLDTYYDRDGFLVDHVGLNAHGIHYDFEVDYYDASFYSWSCYVL